MNLQDKYRLVQQSHVLPNGRRITLYKSLSLSYSPGWEVFFSDYNQEGEQLDLKWARIYIVLYIPTEAEWIWYPHPEKFLDRVSVAEMDHIMRERIAEII